jgi:PAS domain S-box-containing protein
MVDTAERGSVSNEGDGAEVALTSTEEALRLAVETIPALVWRAGPDGSFEYVNKRVLEYLGAPLGEIIGWGWMEKVHPDDVAFKVKSWLESLVAENPHDVVCRIRGAEGRYRWFEVRGEPLRASDGTVLSWYGVLIDIDDQRKVEEALRESEHELRQIIETMPAFLWSTGPDGEPTHVNQRLLDYTGIRFEEFKRVGWEGFVHPDDFPEAARAFYHATHTGTSYQGVVRLRRADGEFRWHHARCEPLRDRQGRIIHWYGVTFDIDEDKKAGKRPRFVARLQATLNVIPAYTWYAAPSGGLTFVNKRTADYLGLPKDHPLRLGVDIGAPWDAHIALLHPDDHEGTRNAWSTCLRTGEAGEVSFRVRNAQGGYRWFHSCVESLRASDGTLLQWVGMNLDIEELKCAEKALRESEEKFRDYAETASDWFWEIGPDYKFTLLSENAYGSDAADRIGTACWDHALDLETEPEKWRVVRATLDARRPFRDFLYRSVRGDGTPMHVKSSGKPVFDANGEFSGYRGTATDVTTIVHAQEQHERQRQLESDLAHMNRLCMMGELAASLAHEITQPIATVRNNAGAAIIFLDKAPPNLGRVREALACVVGDTDRAGQIVDRMLDHLKKAPPRREAFDLNEAVREVLLLVHSEISKNGVSLEARLTQGPVVICGDRVQLQQVVMNLILNAIEAMSSVEASVRKLVISTQHVQPNSIGLGVHDSGPGIDPECLDRVFDAFYTTKSKGVGMGLAICRSIVQAHGGRLWAGANEPRGAVFQFTLPTLQNQLTESLPAAERSGAQREGSEVDALHQSASEGNKRHRHSWPEPDQCRSGRP